MRFPLELKLRGDTVEPGFPKMLDATLHGAWLKPAGADCAALLPGLGNDWAAPLSIEHKNDIVQENEDSRGGADP